MTELDPSIANALAMGEARRVARGETSSSSPRRVGPGSPCRWCESPIPAVSKTGRATRADATFCDVRCRQASWRFGHHRPDFAAASSRPMRFAYADPPYPGMSWRYYREHPDYAGEVDHQQLLEQLVADYPDGWALSTSSKTLRLVLALVPDTIEVRVGAWTKPMPPTRSRLGGVCAWEPVLFCGGRARPADAPTLLDWHYSASPRKLPGQVTGTKPSTFSAWVFRMLGAQAGDELDDLFPGSGAVGRAWERFCSSPLDERDPAR